MCRSERGVKVDVGDIMDGGGWEWQQGGGKLCTPGGMFLMFLNSFLFEFFEFFG